MLYAKKTRWPDLVLLYIHVYRWRGRKWPYTLQLSSYERVLQLTSSSSVSTDDMNGSVTSLALATSSSSPSVLHSCIRTSSMKFTTSSVSKRHLGVSTYGWFTALIQRYIHVHVHVQSCILVSMDLMRTDCLDCQSEQCKCVTMTDTSTKCILTTVDVQ